VPEGGAVPLARMGCGAWCEEEAGGIEEGAPNMREHEINHRKGAESAKTRMRFAFMAVIERVSAGRGSACLQRQCEGVVGV